MFNNKQLGTKATRDVLRDVVHVLIHIILDHRLSQLEDGPQIIRAINVLVVRIVEKAQFTHVFRWVYFHFYHILSSHAVIP